MKKQSLIYMTLALLIFSCSKETLNGSGTLVSESRNVEYFNKVSSEGIFEVTITQGTQQSVEVTADNNIISHLRTRVVNNELRLYLDNDNNYSNLTVQIDLVVTSLNGLKNSGIGNIYATNIDEDGSFSIYNNGTGSINIEGASSSLDIVNEGSGYIFGFDFMVNDCTIEIEGSGDVEVNCSNSLDVLIEGSGNVYYKDFPTINASITGSGEVINDN